MTKETATIFTMCNSSIPPISAALSILYLTDIPRKLILILGGGLSSILIMLSSLFMYYNYVESMFLLTLLFRLSYCTFINSGSFVVVNETCKKEHLYIPNLCAWIFVLINAVLDPYVINYFGITSVIFSFGIFTLINTVIIQYVVKESIGLSKIQLETLYDKKISIIKSIDDQSATRNS